MNLYEIRRADLSLDHESGRDALRESKRQRSRAAQKKLRRIRELLPSCKLSQKPCPLHDDHRAVEGEGVLVCPKTYYVWRCWVALEDGNMDDILKEGIYERLFKPVRHRKSKGDSK